MARRRMSESLDVAASAEDGVLLGVATLSRAYMTHGELPEIYDVLTARLERDPNDACAMLDLSTIAHLLGDAEAHVRLQHDALSRRRIFSLPVAQRDDRVRLLAIVTAGDFMSNTPLEFLVEDGAIALRFLYVAPGEAFPDSLPDHDVAFVAIAEGDRNRAVLEQIETAVATWPRPVLNLPGAIARLTRDGAFRLLKDAPGLVYPVNAAVTRGALEAVVRGATAIETLLDGASYPVLLRPRGTHAGEGLAKIDDAEALAAFLSSQAVDEFYLAQFVDYRSPDGLFRKFRLLFIGDAPYAAHLAISGDWMIHYLNAQMHEERHRAEEALFFERFDDDFAARHRAALTEVARRMQLDYFAIDCGETRDGRLLLFEVGTAMIVHSLDSVEAFPYKQPQMRKVFDRFAAFIREARDRALAQPAAE
jgi:hypothetical protein